MEGIGNFRMSFEDFELQGFQVLCWFQLFLYPISPRKNGDLNAIMRNRCVVYSSLIKGHLSLIDLLWPINKHELELT